MYVCLNGRVELIKDFLAVPSVDVNIQQKVNYAN